MVGYFFAYTLPLVSCKLVTIKTGIKNFQMHVNDTTMNPFFKWKYFFNTHLYAVSSAGGWLNQNMLIFLPAVYLSTCALVLLQ